MAGDEVDVALTIASDRDEEQKVKAEICFAVTMVDLKRAVASVELVMPSLDGYRLRSINLSAEVRLSRKLVWVPGVVRYRGIRELEGAV